MGKEKERKGKERREIRVPRSASDYNILVRLGCLFFFPASRRSGSRLNPPQTSVLSPNHTNSSQHQSIKRHLGIVSPGIS